VQKVLIALFFENSTPLECRDIGPDRPGRVQERMRRWPLMKLPMRLDGDHLALVFPHRPDPLDPG
jgi:hypothetical protein